MLNNKLIIIPLATPWDWTADYLRQTAFELAKNNRVIIYDQLNSIFFLKKKKYKKYKKYKNLIFKQSCYFIPGRRFVLIEKINRKLSFYLFLLKNKKIKKIIWFFDPEQEYFADLKAGKTIKIYDCVDYHAASLDIKEAKTIYKKEQQIIDKVDYFFVNSESLYKLHQKNKKKIILLSAQGFKIPKIRKVQNRQEKKVITLGYIGGINHRLDFQLIDQLAKNNSRWQFIFVGPIQKNAYADQLLSTKKWINQLKKMKNITFYPKQKRLALYKIIETFNLTIIPYNLNIKFNLYCYPMKVFEYLFFGKKIISTPINELKKNKFKNFIYLGKNSNEWERLIKEHGHLPLTIIEQKRAKKMALNNSWQKKIEQISQNINI